MRRRVSPWEQPPHAMASVAVKTIWQSKEIHEAGDPPAGVDSHSHLVPEAPTSPAKGIAKKKKAVSFHGWVRHLREWPRCLPWVLEERRRGQQAGGGPGGVCRIN